MMKVFRLELQLKPNQIKNQGSWKKSQERFNASKQLIVLSTAKINRQFHTIITDIVYLYIVWNFHWIKSASTR